MTFVLLLADYFPL